MALARAGRRVRVDALLQALRQRGEPWYRIAQRAGVSEHRLYRVVHGRTKATPGERAALSQVLGVPEPDLFPAVPEVRAA